MSVAEMLTTAWVELTICVDRRDPFQSATHLLQKLVPVIVTEKAGPPATVLPGESVVRIGVRPQLEMKVELVCAAIEIDKLHKRTKQKKDRNNVFTGVSPKRGSYATGLVQRFH
jgi:hypothetical protein